MVKILKESVYKPYIYQKLGKTQKFYQNFTQITYQDKVKILLHQKNQYKGFLKYTLLLKIIYLDQVSNTILFFMSFFYNK